MVCTLMTRSPGWVGKWVGSLCASKRPDAGLHAAEGLGGCMKTSLAGEGIELCIREGSIC